MNAGKSFGAKLRALHGKIDPLLLIPCYEELEKSLLEYQSTIMCDKEMPVEEKGRMAMVITPMHAAIVKNREMLERKREAPVSPPPKQLHNAQLT